MITFIFSFLLTANAFANDSTPAGCTASRNFSAEAYKSWVSEGSKQTASEDIAQSNTVPVGERVELQLLPVGAEFRGFVNFEIPADGIYVIATDAYPRIDLISAATGESLTPIEFGKIRDCGTVSKALRFQFRKGDKFHLGFVSSQNSILNILIWRLN
jgi:hypothetical protein